MIEKGSGLTNCKTLKILNENKTPMDATVLAALEDLSQIAVGLMDGSVILIKSTDVAKDRFPKMKTIVKPTGFPVTGLEYRQLKGSVVLFITDEKTVKRCVTSNKEYPVLELESGQGAEPFCTCLSEENELVVGRSEAVYFYEPEGRGPCVVFEGKKKMIYWFRQYLVIISQPGEDRQFHAINIYNLKDKFIAFSISNFPAISHIVSEWGSIFIRTQRGEVCPLLFSSLSLFFHFISF